MGGLLVFIGTPVFPLRVSCDLRLNEEVFWIWTEGQGWESLPKISGLRRDVKQKEHLKGSPSGLRLDSSVFEVKVGTPFRTLTPRSSRGLYPTRHGRSMTLGPEVLSSVT